MGIKYDFSFDCGILHLLVLCSVIANGCQDITVGETGCMEL